MRIIKRGDPNKVKVYERVCFKCQTVFEHDETEVQQENWSMYPENYSAAYIHNFVVCPVCEQKLYISQEIILPNQYIY